MSDMPSPTCRNTFTSLSPASQLANASSTTQRPAQELARFHNMSLHAGSSTSVEQVSLVELLAASMFGHSQESTTCYNESTGTTSGLPSLDHSHHSQSLAAILDDVLILINQDEQELLADDDQDDFPSSTDLLPQQYTSVVECFHFCSEKKESFTHQCSWC